MEQHHLDALEGIVDLAGLAEVLGSLAVICREKAEHLESNWQADQRDPSIRSWACAARRIDTARQSQPVQDLALAYGQNAS